MRRNPWLLTLFAVAMLIASAGYVRSQLRERVSNSSLCR